VKGGARRAASALGLGAVLGLVTACGGTTTPAPSFTTAGPSPPTTPSASASPAPTGTVVAPATLAGCPQAQPLDRLTVLHRFSTDADDVAVDAAGRIWVSSPSAGRIDELSPAGVELRGFTNADEPEGLVPLADGRIAVAEQRTNRVITLDPRTGATSALVSVANPSGNLGMDGLGLSADGRELLIPDSPSGRLLEVPVAGGQPSVLATGLGRPVDASPLPDGTIAVASENSPGLRLVAPSGAVRTLGAVSDLDEAVPDNGLIYVTALGAGEALAVDPASGASRVLVTGAPSPQGLTVLPDGRLLLVDSTRRVAVELQPCS
jgi:sugar lactone lactonase YvrE